MGVIAMVSAANVCIKANNWYFGVKDECSILGQNNFKQCIDIMDTKGTDNPTFHRETIDKTMWSTPILRLLSYYGEQRSVDIDLSSG